MALKAYDEDADWVWDPDDPVPPPLAGMSQLIFENMDSLLSPTLAQAVTEAPPEAKDAARTALDQARQGWQKLAYAIAVGVVEHLLTNLEIRDAQTGGNVTVSITGSTATADRHRHGAGTLAGTQNDVTFL